MMKFVAHGNNCAKTSGCAGEQAAMLGLLIVVFGTEEL